MVVEFFMVHFDARVRVVFEAAAFGFGTVWKTVQLLRCFSDPNIGVHHEKLFDLSICSLVPRAFSQLVVQDSGNQCRELFK